MKIIVVVIIHERYGNLEIFEIIIVFGKIWKMYWLRLLLKRFVESLSCDFNTETIANDWRFVRVKERE